MGEGREDVTVGVVRWGGEGGCDGCGCGRRGGRM